MKKIQTPILISGLIGSGKSTLARRLGKKYGLRFISGSQVHRDVLAERLGISVKRMNTPGFWETELGKKGTHMRAGDLNMDKEVDARLVKRLKQFPSSITDSRLMPWQYKGKAIRIWLTAPEKERAARVAQRDGSTHHAALTAIRERGNTDQRIYKKLYGIAFGMDLSPFDLVLTNTGFTPTETFGCVDKYIRVCMGVEKSQGKKKR
ncbi:MAG: cytidylate kinase family protein [Candidatus Diapherotrites archaeon]|nr:cytidylate kinase family protein [Candidatus Diapherotrites archaeon]MDZ4256098.1 cytidylate kinase family protein [archaeon]